MARAQAGNMIGNDQQQEPRENQNHETTKMIKHGSRPPSQEQLLLSKEDFFHKLLVNLLD